MRKMSMFLLPTLVFSLSACNESSKIDDLTKANATLAAELKECRESQKKTAVQEENDKKSIENLKKHESYKSDGPKF